MAQSTESVVTGGTEVPADIDVHTTAGKLADLKRRVAAVAHAGSERAVEKQHARGKKTARERIAMLLDEGSFIEMDKYARHRSNAFGQEKNRPYGDGVVTGYGTVDGRTVAVFAQDFTVFGGSLGEVFGEKICKVMDFAMKIGCPVIGLNDSGGARIQEGVVSLGLYGEIFRRNVHASGVIPQISLIMGPCAGGAVYLRRHRLHGHGGPDLAHVHHRPDVIKTVTGEVVSFEDLGGARAHNTKSGVAHYMGSDEEDAIDYVKALLSYLPSNNLEEPPSYDLENDLAVTDEDRELDVIPTAPTSRMTCTRSSGTCSTTASSSRCSRCSRPTSSAASAASRAGRSASSRTSRCSSPAPSTSTRRRRPPGSSAPATPSTSRS